MSSLLPNYAITRVIGHGTFGYVFEGYDRTNHKKVAIKRIHKVSKQLSREFEILLALKDQPNIIQINDIFISQTDDGLNIQNIVFDYKDYSLEQVIQKAIKMNKLMTSQQIKKLSYQLLNGLFRMHLKGIVHRDLKPENILVDCHDYLEICDFGSAKWLDLNGGNTPYVVSQYYRSPELILSHSEYDYSIDIWATGCIIAEMANLSVLFEGKNEGDQLYQQFQTLGSLSESENTILFSQIDHSEQIASRFTGYEGRSREQWFRLFKHIDNTENFVDLLLSMLQINPQKRITADQALNHQYFK